MKYTYTYALLKVSASAYDEIAGMLRAAGYDQAFHDGAIDMHGIALVKSANEDSASTESDSDNIERAFR